MYRIEPRGVYSFDIKSTELNTKKGLKIKLFRKLEVFFRPSNFCVFRGYDLGENEG